MLNELAERLMRVTFVSWKIGGGGAERVMVNMANYWAEKGWPVHVITLERTDSLACYSLHPNVSHTFFDIADVGRKALPRMGLLKQAFALRTAIRLTSPDAVISLMDGPNVYSLIATWWTHIPVLAVEHCDPNARPLCKRWELLRSLFYRRAASVITLTESAMDYFPKSIRRRGHVVPNPVQAPPHVEQPVLRQPLVVGIGRLHRVKGFDRLITVFASIADRHPHWSLEIWGEGTERPKLESLISDLNLEDRIRLPGYTSRPDLALRRASLFVLSSWTEGFPMGLCEAMACGVPAISFDCPSGPRAIIRDGIDGLLVRDGDLDALRAAMERLMGNVAERQLLAARAPEVIERFNLDSIMKKWESILEKAAK